MSPDARMEADLHHRPSLANTAAIGDAAASAADEVHLPGGEHDRDAEIAEQVEHGAGRLRIERARRLVAKQDLRP
ncbi:MAG: hypothetical protein BGO06_27110 [Shinella sp. 65-6]|nr:MAG: hypothetical protein BGO06_27110 [Shinella sp. 65-6]